MKNTLTLSIDGMHCDACIRRVTNALQAVPGVKVETVKLGSAQMEFTPDQATEKDVADAVNRIGFTAQIEK